MKTGVSTTECGRVISATLALVVEHLASTRNAKAEPSPAPIIIMLKLKSLSRIVCGSHSHQYSGFRFCSPILSISDQFQDQDEPENWAMARYFPAQLQLQLQQKICENWINNRTELSSNKFEDIDQLEADSQTAASAVCGFSLASDFGLGGTASNSNVTGPSLISSTWWPMLEGNLIRHPPASWPQTPPSGFYPPCSPFLGQPTAGHTGVYFLLLPLPGENQVCFPVRTHTIQIAE